MILVLMSGSVIVDLAYQITLGRSGVGGVGDILDLSNRLGLARDVSQRGNADESDEAKHPEESLWPV